MPTAIHRVPGLNMTAPIISRLVLGLLLAFPLSACSTLSSLWPFGGDKGASSDPPAEEPAAIPVEELYNHGVDAMNSKHYQEAGKQFDLVEQNYPYSSWAVNAQLMQGYAQYLQEHYTDAIGTLDRFIQLHPAHRDIAYAYYLRALCYYEQISDIQRDQKATLEAMGALQEVMNRFPDSAYARDAQLKMDLCRDHLAGKEMEIGRYYERQHLYTAAIGRFQRVVDDYQTTNHVAEALHRLTEIYLKLGLVSEARRTAAVLGYNYPGSPWYEHSYDDLVATGNTTDQRGPATASDGSTEHPGFFARVWQSVF
jgi:outer membrane protein assembly factor BamD